MNSINDNWINSIFSDGSNTFIDKNNPNIGEKINIKVRIIKNSPVERVYIRYLKNGEETVALMEKEQKRNFDFYSVAIEINQPILNYHFLILTKDKTYFYNQLGVSEYNITEDYDFKIIANFKEPNWTKDSIFYQIFVDRFFNGDEKNDVKDFEYESYGFSSSKIDWNQKPGEYKDYGNLNFYGGDLKGIEEKIPYLKNLGVNALYLNPIFESPSNHKYDCSDFLHVDKHFGGDRALEDLVKKLHDNDIKIVVDISINHTGILNKWIKEHPEFYYTKKDGEFEFWNGVKTLPVLNYTNKKLQNIMYNDNDSVLKHWLKEPYNIDGWRLDVGHNVGKMNIVQMDKTVWRKVRKSIKETNNDAYIVAEHWTDCSKYLQGDMWDGTMNYFGFMRPVRRYLGENDKFLGWKIENLKMTTNTGSILKEEVCRHYGRLPYQLQHLQLNLLSSHDLHRLHHSPIIDRENLKAGIIMLFTFVGIPCVYYGDEILLHGDYNSDQGCRYPMQWNDEKYDKEINDLYKKMIKLRKNEELLKNGSFKFLKHDLKKIVYCRFNEGEAIVFINSQENEKSFIDINFDYLGEVQSVEIIYGEHFKYDVNKNTLYSYIKSKSTILLRVHFK